jgi:hypothetical protein
MRSTIKALALAAGLAVVSTWAAHAASSSQVNSQFRSAVSKILNSVRPDVEFLRDLSSSEFRAFVSCAQGIMDGAPLARKQYVLAAGSLSAQRQRFDEVALDNRAALKQEITRKCA